MFARILAVAFFGLTVVLPAVGQIPPGYEVVQLTDSPFPEGNVAMNDRGLLVFNARTGPLLSSQEILLYDDNTGEITQITDNNVRDLRPVINNEGAIAWISLIGEGPGDGTWKIMVRSPNGEVTRLTDNSLSESSPSINSLGQIAWHRFNGRGCAGSGSDVMFYDGTTTRQITDNDWSNQSVELNDQGQMIWTEYDFCPGGFNWISLIKLYSDGKIIALSQAGHQSQSPTINNYGVCAWGFNDPHSIAEGIQVWADGVRSLFTDWGIIPHLNDRRDMVLIRWHDDTSTWQVWLYLNGEFFQITDAPFWNGGTAINNAGEVSWRSDPKVTSKMRFMRRLPAGDLNCDGAFDGADIDLFFFALRDRTEYEAAFPDCDWMLGDMNGDNAVDGADIDPFLIVLGGG